MRGVEGVEKCRDPLGGERFLLLLYDGSGDEMEIYEDGDELEVEEDVEEEVEEEEEEEVEEEGVDINNWMLLLEMW
ncbi:hypothetical protein TWF703_006272 [Orbilia oligospora]|uniref:Uncharacterized protein n=1 Tax=Orbilia oligospora TaxID=2813651 RepID=A0A7C8NK17_ORBOL|nr:hypothetical protein TWF703_006272 [Orbilia oligospora]